MTKWCQLTVAIDKPNNGALPGGQGVDVSVIQHLNIFQKWPKIMSLNLSTNVQYSGHKKTSTDLQTVGRGLVGQVPVLAAMF